MRAPRFERIKESFKNDGPRSAVYQTLINIAALLPLVCYGFRHYTADSYLVAFHYEWHWSAFIGSFRYFGALLIRLWTLFFDPVAGPLPDIAVFIILSAVGVTLLSHLLYKRAGLKGRLLFFMTDLAVLISIANVFLGNVLQFPECIFPLAVGVFLCLSGVCVYFARGLSPWIRFPAAGLMFICSAAVYQQLLTVFTVYGLLLIALELIRSERTTAKKAFWAVAGFVAFVGVCTVVYYGIGLVVQKAFEIGRNPRAVFTPESIIENIKYYLLHQRSILGGKGLFGTKLLRRCFYAAALVWAVSAAVWLKKNKITVKNALTLLVFPAAYASVFTVGCISSDPGGVRVLMGLFSVFALLGVGAAAFLKESKLRFYAAVCLTAVMLTVFSMNTYKNVQTFYGQTVLNTAEIELTKNYLREIEKYESETGNTVKTVVFGRDADPDDCSENAYRADWGVAGILDYVSGGRIFDARYITVEEQTLRFGEGRDWKVYEPAEQLVFEGDTLYICVY